MNQEVTTTRINDDATTMAEARRLDEATRSLALVAYQQHRDYLALLERLATNTDVAPEKLAAVLSVKHQIDADQDEIAFNQAFNAMESALPRIRKDGVVEYRKDGKLEKSFKFASWNQIDDMIRPTLRQFGFSLSFDSAPRTGDGGGMIVTGKLIHQGKHTRTASIPLALDMSGGKNAVQAMGSTFRYGQRYTAIMLLNLTIDRDDDDGVAAGQSFLNAEQVADLMALLATAETGGLNRAEYLRWVFKDELPHDFSEVESHRYAALRNGLLARIQKQSKQ